MRRSFVPAYLAAGRRGGRYERQEDMYKRFVHALEAKVPYFSDPDEYDESEDDREMEDYEFVHERLESAIERIVALVDRLQHENRTLRTQLDAARRAPRPAAPAPRPEAPTPRPAAPVTQVIILSSDDDDDDNDDARSRRSSPADTPVRAADPLVRRMSKLSVETKADGLGYAVPHPTSPARPIQDLLALASPSPAAVAATPTAAAASATPTFAPAAEPEPRAATPSPAVRVSPTSPTSPKPTLRRLRRRRDLVRNPEPEPEQVDTTAEDDDDDIIMIEADALAMPSAPSRNRTQRASRVELLRARCAGGDTLARPPRFLGDGLDKEEGVEDDDSDEDDEEGGRCDSGHEDNEGSELDEDDSDASFIDDSEDDEDVGSAGDEDFDMTEAEAAEAAILKKKCAPARVYLTGKAFKKQRVALAAAAFAEFNRAVFDSKLPADLPVVWKPRLTRTAGRFRGRRAKPTRYAPLLPGSLTDPTAATVPDDGYIYSGSVELSTKVVDSEDRLRSTLLHELCHAATWYFSHSVKPPHGPLFHAWAKRATRAFPADRVTVRHTYDIKRRFHYVCQTPGCGHAHKRHSRSIDVAWQGCGKCGTGALVLHEMVGDELVLLGTAADADAAAAAGAPVKVKAPRPLTAYQVFVKEQYAAVKRARPGAAHKDVMAALGQMWAEQKKMQTQK
ncbi:hypothetical protein H9P43_007085 [Blastocladiella emersonii ATCC 22665]|nr:hypothetical protein H9P43_007085 [Blastocladiella emersonii ATCC 22665]